MHFDVHRVCNQYAVGILGNIVSRQVEFAEEEKRVERLHTERYFLFILIFSLSIQNMTKKYIE